MPSTINATPTSSGLVQSADASGVLALQTGGTTAVTIDGSQNVGIGTTNPSVTGYGKAVRLQGTGNAAYEVTDGTVSTVLLSTAASLGVVRTDTNHALVLGTNGTERMRIDTSGALLVNTTVATGTVNFSVAADTTTRNPMSVNNTRTTAATDFSILFYRAGNIVGSVQTSLSATSFVTSSDYRLKENIAPMTGALGLVQQLKPVTYTWKSDGSAGQGFIAHELQAVVPDCVTGQKDAIETYTDEDGNEQTRIRPQGIDTSFLVATLTAAIQEQQALITQLQADVAALKVQP